MNENRKKSSWKRVIAWILITISAVIGLIALFIGYLALDQHVWESSKQKVPGQLTAEQKQSDFRLLTQITAKYYPFSNVNVSVKGLDDFTSINDGYIERAGKTKDNQEFLALFDEYLQRIHQTGHAYLLSPQEAKAMNTFGMRMLLDLKKENFQTSDYWYMLWQSRNTAAYSALSVEYLDGFYCLADDQTIGGIELPRGTQLTAINGIEIDQYVKSLQNRHFLRFDQAKGKVYLPDPFSVDNQDGKDCWDVQFKRKEGDQPEIRIQKIYGIKKDPRFGRNPFNRNFCMELAGGTAYIRVFRFPAAYQNDLAMIQDFMGNPQKEYRKLILDIRGNDGGDPQYWMKVFIQPMIKKERLYQREAAVRKEFLKDYGIPLKLYQSLGGGLFHKEAYFFQDAVKIKSDHADDSLQSYLVTRKFTPKNTFPFEGEVYLLADNDCFSAAEDFVSAMKELKLAVIAGANTQGGGAAFLQSFPFCLPESGILFAFEPEITYNPDGSINEVNGTKPDITLEQSSYPTPYPLSSEKEDLLQDPWIQWALTH